MWKMLEGGALKKKDNSNGQGLGVNCKEWCKQANQDARGRSKLMEIMRILLI